MTSFVQIVVNAPAVEKIILTIFSSTAARMLLIAGITAVSNILKIGREARAPGKLMPSAEPTHA